jgi:hypothetical protein
MTTVTRSTELRVLGVGTPMGYELDGQGSNP